ncbi:hypothetical protein BOTBODRAFT_126918 [Botryobasidium botryosum FD-172 SS1]|uniref:Pre-rRNA-processing protein RIX1 n=1 Tax=Botryobasidium botryosum (strain FD-172 SS1) TaxID=930990 RepID=A0A067N5K0_BOTB1|nr:hypothetical protein BOTBODRAFT_126918 [Botryobasidium botryosum FD-172 SS1]
MPHHLETLLQYYLVTDQVAVLHLPLILSSLARSHFRPSQHLQKWKIRAQALIQSKDSGARWAGLCLARECARLDKELLVDCAQSWLAVVLPMLSRNEPLPVLKAAIHLLSAIFSSATDMPEFQRQVSIPNIPKFSLSLVSLAERDCDEQLKILSLHTISSMLALYPTLHRALQPSLHKLAMQHLNGSFPSPTPPAIVCAAVNLHASLHFTGGKVGGATVWRKSVNEAIDAALVAIGHLTLTLGNGSAPVHAPPAFDLTLLPLALGRLKCMVALIIALLQSSTSRPVPMPVASLANLCLRLLGVTLEDDVSADQNFFDVSQRALEVSVMPELWKLGCQLTAQLAKCTRRHLTPHASRLLSHVIYHMEKPLSSIHRLPFLHALPPLLTHTCPTHSTLLPNRLLKSILGTLTKILPSSNQMRPKEGSGDGTAGTGSKRGKKRARGYEGDEVFRVGKEVICKSDEEGEEIIAALTALPYILENHSQVSRALHSLSRRMLLSLLLSLPRQPASSLSVDLSLHGRVLAKVTSLCEELVVGMDGWALKSVGLVVGAVGTADGSEETLKANTVAQSHLEVLLHPRLPPLLRSLPALESISLYRTDESKDEKEARVKLGVEPGGASTLAAASEAVDNAVSTTSQQPASLPTVVSAGPETYSSSSTHALSASVVSATSAPVAPLSPAAPPTTQPIHDSPMLPAKTNPVLAEQPATAPKKSQARQLAPSSVAFSTIPQVQPVAIDTPRVAEKRPAAFDEDSDNDEEMPFINMDSDSD